MLVVDTYIHPHIHSDEMDLKKIYIDYIILSKLVTQH